MQYLIACCRRQKANSDVISSILVGLVVPDNRVKLFRDPCATYQLEGQVKRRTTKIRPKAVGSGNFRPFYELR